jgi:hypothetical protein
MPLSSGNDANVAQMLDWLRDDEAGPAAVALRDLLGSVVFDDSAWADDDDSSSVSGYRETLAAWFAGDPDDETQFVTLTPPGDESASSRDIFVTWFTPVVKRWQEVAETSDETEETGEEAADETDETGEDTDETGDDIAASAVPNPDFNGTPGTEFVWKDPATGGQLYASTADAPDSEWLSYEQRRVWTAVAYDSGRDANYRQDVYDEEFQFQSRDDPSRWLPEEDWEKAFGAPVSQGPPVQTEQADNSTEVPEAEAQRQAAVTQVFDQIMLPALVAVEQSGNPAIAALLSHPHGLEQLQAEIMRQTAQGLADASS